jgi:hypothetical protein
MPRAAMQCTGTSSGCHWHRCDWHWQPASEARPAGGENCDIIRVLASESVLVFKDSTFASWPCVLPQTDHDGPGGAAPVSQPEMAVIMPVIVTAVAPSSPPNVPAAARSDSAPKGALSATHRPGGCSAAANWMCASWRHRAMVGGVVLAVAVVILVGSLAAPRRNHSSTPSRKGVNLNGASSNGVSESCRWCQCVYRGGGPPGAACASGSSAVR